MTGTTAKPAPGYSLDLPDADGAAARGREFTHHALTRLGWLPTNDPTAQTLADDIVLLVSELVTNARRHATAPFRLHLHPTPRGLRIETTDASTTHPTLRPDQPAVPGGFGMRLINTLTDTWGITTHPNGKTIWLEVTR